VNQRDEAIRNLVAATAERDRYCEMVMQVRKICEDDANMANAKSLRDEASALGVLYDRIVAVVYPFDEEATSAD
jgi:hypothetical protein